MMNTLSSMVTESGMEGRLVSWLKKFQNCLGCEDELSDMSFM